MAERKHDCEQWLELMATPEGVMVEYCEHGCRRERQLSKLEAVALHERALANAERRRPRDFDPANPGPPPNPDDLRAQLERHFDKAGLK